MGGGDASRRERSGDLTLETLCRLLLTPGDGDLRYLRGGLSYLEIDRPKEAERDRLVYRRGDSEKLRDLERTRFNLKKKLKLNLTSNTSLYIYFADFDGDNESRLERRLYGCGDRDERRFEERGGDGDGERFDFFDFLVLKYIVLIKLAF